MHATARARPPHPAFPAFLAGAGRPLLPSMIDYSLFSQLAAARASIISGPDSRSAPLLSISTFQGQIRLRRHLVIGSQGRWPGGGERPRTVLVGRIFSTPVLRP